MNQFITLLLCMTVLILALYMLAQGFRSTVDLLSVRNFFLIGFIIFQLTSAAVTLYTGVFPDLPIRGLPGTGIRFFFLALIALSLFLWAYSRGWLVRRLARMAPVGDAAPGVTSLLTLAIAFLALGMVFRLVLIYVPYLGKLTGIVGIGICAVAAGMAAWAWAPRVFNPIVGAVAIMIMLIAMGTAMHHNFGRRDLMSVVLCIMWGAYHGHWKHLRPARAVMWLAAAGVAGMVLLAAFTAVRGAADQKRSAVETVSLMTRGDVKGGVRDLLSGQLAGQNSMWMMENYPDRFEYRTLSSLYYFVTQPIPRAFFPNKPTSLATDAVDQAGAGEGKPEDFTIGPGLVGHIWADNPWICLVLYPVLLGLFIRFLDEIVTIHGRSPFMVLPVGVALGQVIGMPRGELGLFLFQSVSGIITAFLCMLAVARVMALFGWRMQYESLAVVGHDHHDEGDAADAIDGDPSDASDPGFSADLPDAASAAR